MRTNTELILEELAHLYMEIIMNVEEINSDNKGMATIIEIRVGDLRNFIKETYKEE